MMVLDCILFGFGCIAVKINNIIILFTDPLMG